MLLHTLLHQFDSSLSLAGIPNLRITGLHEDSRKISPGQLFIARTGTKIAGGAFASDAKNRGAVAVVTQSNIANCPLPQIVVSDASTACSQLAHLFHGSPSQKLRVLGITGTNGKTTAAYLARHILGKVKLTTGVIGTVEIDDGKTRREADQTTPSAIDVAQLLATMRDNGCKAAAMEVSSHALDQGRCAAVKFAAAGFSNLTGDHLDYHHTMENYAAAKARLFESLEEDACAVVNIHDPWSWRMLRDCKARQVSFGFSENADYRARDLVVRADGSHFILITPDGQTEVHSAMVGRHNVENILLTAGMLCETFGLSVHQISSALKDTIGAPGRLQAVRCGQPFAVLVDYAHSDDALRNVLTALRPLCKGRLRVLFGCGGDRDRTKRPRMAQTAQQLADDIYITSDNPRTENPQSILDQIRAGLAGADVYENVDRRVAIEQIISDAQPGDVVLIAGKGHENYQIIGQVKHHFDDAEEAARVLQSRAAFI